MDVIYREDLFPAAVPFQLGFKSLTSAETVMRSHLAAEQKSEPLSFTKPSNRKSHV